MGTKVNIVKDSSLGQIDSLSPQIDNVRDAVEQCSNNSSMKKVFIVGF